MQRSKQHNSGTKLEPEGPVQAFKLMKPTSAWGEHRRNVKLADK